MSYGLASCMLPTRWTGQEHMGQPRCAPVPVPILLCPEDGYASVAAAAAPLRRIERHRCALADACSPRFVDNPTHAVPAGGALPLQACAARLHTLPRCIRQGRLRLGSGRKELFIWGTVLQGGH